MPRFQRMMGKGPELVRYDEYLEYLRAQEDGGSVAPLPLNMSHDEWLAAVTETYTIERDLTNHRKVKPWIVLKDGVRMPSPRSGYCTFYFTRKAAQEDIDADVAYDAWLARLYLDDFERVYRWSEDEGKQIDEYAGTLKENRLRWTFAGQFPIRQTAREQHWKSCEDLKRWDWGDATKFHAETRRTMAARLEAFKRAGVEF